MEEQVHKPHRKAKAKKQQNGERNPKAFAVTNPGRLGRTAARSSDIKEKRFHVPLVDRLPDVPPPRLVAIVGPPGVGKTTLLKSLIRRYAKETLSDPQGPITAVTSKKQRLTFIECPNELEAMVDIAKVADIILLMIDGNYGFEMETMEFLNILANTGMPGNVFGILTHLDLFRKPQALKEAKKRLKRRFWTELYSGAKLFYLSGVLNGRYPDREVHNISRFLSVMKSPRPLLWRNTHPYTLIDSFRDITHPTKIEDDEKCDRSIVLSGYLRGTNFSAQGQRVHIPGLGDFTVANMEVLPDPCPTPAMEDEISRATGKTGRRRLDENEKKLHAPMSDRSGLKIDGDAIWITREKGFTFDKDVENAQRGEGEELIIGLQSERKLLGHTDEGVQLFKGGEQVKQVQEDEGDTGRKSRRQVRLAEDTGALEAEGGPEEEDVASDDEHADSDVDVEFDEGKLGKIFGRGDSEVGKAAGADHIEFADSDSDLGSISSGEEGEGEGEDYEDDEDFDSDEEVAALKWKENMTERAHKAHSRKQPFRTVDLARYMYDESMTPSEAIRKWRGQAEEDKDDIEQSDEDDFLKKSNRQPEDQQYDGLIPQYDYEQLAAKWSAEEHVDELRRKFAAADLLNGHDEHGGGDDDAELDEGDGVFEDLETGEQHGPEEPLDLDAEREKNAQRREEHKLRFEHEDREGFLNDKANARRDAGDPQEFGEDEWYDAKKARIQTQLNINKAEFENLDERQRVAVEGFQAGKYAKLVIEGVPAEFVAKFSTRMPLVVGGLSATEDRFGFVQVRIKRHRWHKKILKTGDPLIFSLGWRRFQTLPIYSISDSRTRNRMLKYTPEHMHCFGTIYGPLIAPNTGFVCFQSFSTANPGFRIAATGTVLSVDESTEIVKKLKLTGAPYKIFKNTAFIKDMFNSALEVAKFEGAAVKTVSGVRGQIKRALSKPEGHFRATFEDKILLSDIVFLRAWYPVKPRRFYNPVTNLVGWTGMRLTGEIRRDEGLPTPQQRNSRYRPVAREARHFNPLRVPRALAAELPFRSQIVQTKPQKNETYMQKRAVVVGGREKRIRNLMQQLTTVRKDVVERRRAKKEEKRVEFRQRMTEMEDAKAARDKKDSKVFWRKEGRKRGPQTEGGGAAKKRK